MIPGSKKTTRSHYITFDVIEKILRKLPLKSIIRFRSVCKTWCDLSKSCRFAALHHTETDYQSVVQIWVNLNHLGRRMENTSISNRDLENVWSSLKPEKRIFTLHARMWKQGSRHEIKISNLDSENAWPNRFELGEVSARESGCGFMLAGNCNGIVCISNYSKIFLINPSLRKMKEIPVEFEQGLLHFVGLGFDRMTSDFKVVTIAKTLTENQRRAQVYSLSTNSWTDVGEIPIGFSMLCSFSTFFNGFLHWCVSGTDYSSRMLTFNISSHVFKQIKLPQTVEIPGEASLLVLNSKLLAFVSTSHITCINTDHMMDIWVMKEYGVEESWIKLYSFGSRLNILKPVSFWEEDKLLFWGWHEKLILYDLLQHQPPRLIDLSVDPPLGSRRIYNRSLVCVCKESLTSFSRESLFSS